MGGAQAFYPKEDNASGLVGLTSSNPRSNIILGLSRQPCRPAHFLYIKEGVSKKTDAPTSAEIETR